jgi:hypothetical protein
MNIVFVKFLQSDTKFTFHKMAIFFFRYELYESYAGMSWAFEDLAVVKWRVLFDLFLLFN